MEDLDIMTYLMYIYQRLGRTVFNQVLTDLGGQIDIQKTLTLDELHIYGSSRHGIHKPEKRVIRKTYVLEEIETDGTFDYGTAQDSTIAKISYTSFSRKLTYKQYELSNHLGNVLATVLDRKTPQIGADTVLYYDADVSTAGMYYAFGSAMSDLSYTHISGTDTAKYRYGFNGEEGEADIAGDGMVYDLGARFYDARLGRMFSLDPLMKDYAWQSPYAYCNNRPNAQIDLKGMGDDKGLKSGEGALSYGRRMGIKGTNTQVLNQLAISNPDVFKNYNENWSDKEKGEYWKSAKDFHLIKGDVLATNKNEWVLMICQKSLKTVNEKLKPVYTSNDIKDQISNENRLNSNDKSKEQVNWNSVHEDYEKSDFVLGQSAEILERLGPTYRLFRNSGKTFSPKIYTSGWTGGSRGNIRTFNLGKTVGTGLGVLSVGVDMLGVYNYYTLDRNDPNVFTVNPAKAGLNTAVTIYSSWNPWAGGLYFGMDAFYPGGWEGAAKDYERTSKANQRILGPRFIQAPYGSQKF